MTPSGLEDWHIAWNPAGMVVTVTHSGLAYNQTCTASVTAEDALAKPIAATSLDPSSSAGASAFTCRRRAQSLTGGRED